MTARLYPDPIPEAIRADPHRSAERRVCEALVAQLDERCRVFFGVPWLVYGPDGRMREGEVDLVVLDPRKGLLCLEVKGGQIARDGQTGRWTSRDRSGVTHEIKDPVPQAVRSKYALIEKIRGHPRWKGVRLPLAHAVAFPDCSAPATALAPDCPPELVIAGEQLPHLADRIADTFHVFAGADARSAPLDTQAVEVITSVLAPTFTLRSPLGLLLAEEDRQILALDEGQFRLLNAAAGLRRVAVRGGAGTGKTVLAAEKARRLAAEGFRVLLTCFNKPLGDYLRASLGDAPNLEVVHFHQFCHDFARGAGVTIPDAPEEGPDTAYFARFPDLLLEALDRTERRFDAIVVDEGQDFEKSWWEVLELCLDAAGPGILYVFYDDQQQLYQREIGLPSGLVELLLDRNHRNTRAIHETARRFYSGPPLDAAGPPGRPVAVEMALSEAALPATLSRVLHRLVHEERVPTHEVAVLTGQSLRKSPLGSLTKLGAYTLTQDPAAGPGRILIHSVHRFKGLERQVVVLTDLEALASGADARRLYVGTTRARAYLVVVATADTLARLGFVPQP